MAIIVEQEKKPINWINLIVVVVFVVLIFALVYYVFFKNPEFVETIIPAKLETISSLKEIKVDPNPVLGILKKYFITTYIPESSNSSLGRINPFEPF